MLVDSHCHLDFPDFAPELDDVVGRARAAGVGTMVTISTHVRRFERYAAIASAYPDVWCSVGTHPHHAAEEPDVSAAVFRTHIAAARQTGLPLVIHSRDADADMAAILADEMGKGAFKAVLHCFSSGAGLAAAGLELGLFVSFSGILTFRRSDELRAIAATVPLDRLLVETDAPYLAPQAWRGKRNEPAYLAATCATLAEVHGMSADAMAEQTTRNFFRLFSKAEAPAGAVAA